MWDKEFTTNNDNKIYENHSSITSQSTMMKKLYLSQKTAQEVKHSPLSYQYSLTVR